MNKRNILKLVEAMRKLPPEANQHFDMRCYINHPDIEHKHPVPRSPVSLLNQCGTTACALGWAYTMPEFRKAGLRWAKSWGEVRGEKRCSA